MNSTKGIKLIMIGAVIFCLTTLVVSADEIDDEIPENETADSDTPTEDLLITPGPDKVLEHNVTDGELEDDSEFFSGDEEMLISPGPEESENLIAPGPNSEGDTYTLYDASAEILTETTSTKPSLLTFPPLVIGLFVAFLGGLLILGKRC